MVLRLNQSRFNRDAAMGHVWITFSELADGLQGRERVSSVLGSLPQLVDSDAWDGGEGSAPEEEEFSLEDLMADDKEEL